MIRPATVSDIPRLLEWSEAFAAKAQLIENVGYVSADVEATLTMMVEGGHPVFIGEHGAIGAVAVPHLFNRTHSMAQEVFWWSEGREGLRLFDTLDRWCADNCDSLRMITLEAIKPEATGRLYERKGFRLLEHSYLKVY